MSEGWKIPQVEKQTIFSIFSPASLLPAVCPAKEFQNLRFEFNRITPKNMSDEEVAHLLK